MQTLKKQIDAINPATIFVGSALLVFCVMSVWIGVLMTEGSRKNVVIDTQAKYIRELELELSEQRLEEAKADARAAKEEFDRVFGPR